MNEDKNKIKLLQVVWSFDVGGAEKLAYDIVCNLPPGEFHPVICCIEHDGPLGEKLRTQGYTVYHRKKKPGVDLSLAHWLRGIIRKENISVIHAHQYNPMFYSVLAALGCPGVELIYTEHGRTYPEQSNFKRRLLNPLLAKRIDHLVTISESTRQAMARLDRFPLDRISVVHNGVFSSRKDSAWDRVEKKIALGLDPATKVVGTAARLEQVKNLPMMLRAFKAISERRADICLVVAGIGSQEKALGAMVAELGLSDKVKFLGLRNDLPEVFSCFDVFLLSSYTEGISITLLEAMASGVPAVVTNVGGNPEVVVDGQTGFLVPLHDDQTMVDRTLEILGNQEFSARASLLGRDRVERVFSFSRMMDQYLRLYRNLPGRNV